MPLAPRVGTIRQVQRRRPPQQVETNFATNVTDDELRRAIVSARALQVGTPATGGTAAAPRTVTDIRHRVHRWSVLVNRRNHETAARTIERCVRVLQPLMIVLRTATLSVEEFFPRNERLLGLNTNSGQRIQVRLRPAARPEAFLPLESVLHTLAHEVTHNFISPHNRAFFELHERITSLCERLIALGAMDDAALVPPLAAAAFGPVNAGAAFVGQGRTLGGGDGDAAPPPRAQLGGVAGAGGGSGPQPGAGRKAGKGAAKFPGVGRVAANGPTGTSAGPLAAAFRRRARDAGAAPDYETMRGQMLRAVLLRLAAAERAEAEGHLMRAATARRSQLQQQGGGTDGGHDDSDRGAMEDAEDDAVAPVCTCGTSCIDVDAVCAAGDECSSADDDGNADRDFWATFDDSSADNADRGASPAPPFAPEAPAIGVVAASPVVGVAVASPAVKYESASYRFEETAEAFIAKEKRDDVTASSCAPVADGDEDVIVID